MSKAYNTKTSDEIIKGLEINGVVLANKDKQLIIDKVYNAVAEAYNYESNGCDCGQMCCATCHE